MFNIHCDEKMFKKRNVKYFTVLGLVRMNAHSANILNIYFFKLIIQVSIGQYAGVGPIKIFGRMAPLAGGLGLAVVGVSLFLGQLH